MLHSNSFSMSLCRRMVVAGAALMVLSFLFPMQAAGVVAFLGTDSAPVDTGPADCAAVQEIFTGGDYYVAETGTCFKYAAAAGAFVVRNLSDRPGTVRWFGAPSAGAACGERTLALAGPEIGVEGLVAASANDGALYLAVSGTPRVSIEIRELAAEQVCP